MQNIEDVKVLEALALQFYDVVPSEYKTYCTMTARIAQKVLGSFDVETTLQPCQVWYATPNHNYVVGFTGQAPKDGKWDGHVICRTNSN